MKKSELKNVIKEVIAESKKYDISAIPNSKGEYEKIPKLKSGSNSIQIKPGIYRCYSNKKINVISIDDKYVFYNVIDKNGVILPKILKMLINSFRKEYYK